VVVVGELGVVVEAGGWGVCSFVVFAGAANTGD
jgi:hypothetical protein